MSSIFRRARRRSRSSRTSDILVVCTGNVCRSPFIATLVRAQRPGIIVTSAGTGALVSELPTQPVRDRLAARGVSVADLPRAQQLTRDLVRSTRLILTATRQHRAFVVAMDPSAAPRTLTLKELARILADSPNTRGLDAILGLAAEHVARGEVVDYDDDLDDPYGLDVAAYDRMASDVDEALAVILPALAAR